MRDLGFKIFPSVQYFLYSWHEKRWRREKKGSETFLLEKKQILVLCRALTWGDNSVVISSTAISIVASDV